MIDAIVLALALSMDATAVAAARSASGVAHRDVLRMAVAFGVFQAGMAALGWAVGAAAARWIAQWDHWIAFGLLSILGVKMLVEALRNSGGDEGDGGPVLSTRMVILLAIATSIDALAAGVTLPILRAPEIVSVALIGAVTFAMSLLGGAGARWIGARGGRVLEILGGVALVAIGVKTLVDHLG